MANLGLGQRLFKHIDSKKAHGACHPQPTVLMYHYGGCALDTMVSHSPFRDYLQETDCVVYSSMETCSKTCEMVQVSSERDYKLLVMSVLTLVQYPEFTGELPSKNTLKYSNFITLQEGTFCTRTKTE